MKRLFAAAVTALAMLAQPALAQAASEQPVCAGCPTASEIRQLYEFQQKQSATPQVVGPLAGPIPAAVQTPTPVVAPPSPAAPAPVTQNTVATTGPVSSETTISVGTLAGQFLTWATLVFGSILSSFGTALIIKLLKNAGVQGTELLSDKLDRILLNGINLGASTLTKDMAGKGQVEIKNAVATQAIAYVQAHGADTIKALGLEPNSPEAVEAIKARIETAIADPAVPTAKILDNPSPVPSKG